MSTSELSTERAIDRRDFFSWAQYGLGGAALATLLVRDGFAEDAAASAQRGPKIPGEADDPPPHHSAKAKRAIHICLCGGLSHIDSFDYKPALAKHHGQKLGGDERPDVFFGQVGLIRKNDWEFAQHGKSGLWVSALFPHIAKMADELTVIRSMVAESSSHLLLLHQVLALLLCHGRSPQERCAY